MATAVQVPPVKLPDVQLILSAEEAAVLLDLLAGLRLGAQTADVEALLGGVHAALAPLAGALEGLPPYMIKYLSI